MTSLLCDSTSTLIQPANNLSNHTMDMLGTTGNGRTSADMSSSLSADLQKLKSSTASSGNTISPVGNKNGNGMSASKLSSSSAAEDDECYPVRTKLPVQQPDKNTFTLWSHLKNCIGKEGDVVMQCAPVADPAVGAYIGEGADRNIHAYFCGRVNNHMFVFD